MDPNFKIYSVRVECAQRAGSSDTYKISRVTARSYYSDEMDITAEFIDRDKLFSDPYDAQEWVENRLEMIGRLRER